MSTEPPPGSGQQPPDDDPFRKHPPPGSRPPPQQGGGPYGSEGGDPYSGGGSPSGGGGGPYGGGGGDSPYGPGPGNPLAGMPPLADSRRRTLARVIDMILVGLVAWPFGVSEYTMSGDEVDVGKSFVQSLVAAVLYIAYDTFMTSRSGQTLGKKWLKLRVADLSNGSTPSVQTSLVRALVLWVPFAFCCDCVWTVIAGGWSFFDKPYKQGLHDKAAKTVVVSAR
ncbi:RDD family protein [Streptomyces sp. KMM 9044]|uniref:RDD family protein n=1 Tax=Streptomyces sp. KMM 9044 TaxID=2744474 RepID=UPI0021518ADF|nr:RDD family protein [Streptomyces sp. KMM 9044]WAX79783.1 RDD family protein [Streptomyces sp. KMM 9044]